MDGVHDLGGLEGFGPVVTADGELGSHEDWELRAQALAILGVGGTVRPWIEQIEPADYLAATYYERWLVAAERGSVARGKIATADLDRWQAVFEADEDARPAFVADPALRSMVDHMMTHAAPMAQPAVTRFRVGDLVRVRRMRTSGQNRCPRYVRGATGRIERICGEDRVPGSSDAHDVAPVYTVEFSSGDLWGAGGEPMFTVLVDLCERYLISEDES